MSGHRREFDLVLEGIEAQVIELFAMIAEDLPRATTALLTGDENVLPSLAGHQQAVDALYPRLEVTVSRTILREAPVACDLRFLLSVLRVARHFERAHHAIVQIAARADGGLSASLTPRCHALLRGMGDLAADMWRQAADAWYHRDRSAATVLAVRADEMGDLHEGLIAELASGAVPVTGTIELTLAAHLYERLAAHAAGVATRVGYLAGHVPGN
jgi:phosphate transport system protein